MRVDGRRVHGIEGRPSLSDGLRRAKSIADFGKMWKAAEGQKAAALKQCLS